jgi:hypothetical protein
MVLDDTHEFVNKVPWTLTNDMSWKDISKGRRLPIRGGVRLLEFRICDGNNPLPCPAKKVGRCGESHPNWMSIGNTFDRFQLDDLVRLTAAGEYVSVVVPGERLKNRWWVRATDRDRFLDAGGTLFDDRPAMKEPRADRLVEIRPRPLDPTCRYGEDTGYRSPPPVSQDDDDLVVSAVTASTERLCCGERAPAVMGTPLKPFCQLCPNSPTYWRLTHRYDENGPCPTCGLVRCAVGQRDDPTGGHDV